MQSLWFYIDQLIQFDMTVLQFLISSSVRIFFWFYMFNKFC